MSPAKPPQQILETSRDQRELETAGVALASSHVDADIALLEGHLRTSAFLRRLDTTTDPYIKTKRFDAVVARLGDNRSKRAGEALRTLIQSPDVKADTVRVQSLLRAAAQLRPMTEERLDVLRSVPRETYYLGNLGLLFANTSPPALDEARHMVLSKPAAIADPPVVDIMHLNIVSRRTNVNLIHMAVSLSQDQISAILRRGLVECFFDYNYDLWFEPMRNAPEPPPWRSAPDESRRAILELARVVQTQDIPESLKEKAAAVAAEVRQTLAPR